jgi:hypothetical protein
MGARDAHVRALCIILAAAVGFFHRKKITYEIVIFDTALEFGRGELTSNICEPFGPSILGIFINALDSFSRVEVYFYQQFLIVAHLLSRL